MTEQEQPTYSDVLKPQLISVVQSYRDGGWALYLHDQDHFIGLEEWQFRRLIQHGVQQLQPEDYVSHYEIKTVHE